MIMDISVPQYDEHGVAALSVGGAWWLGKLRQYNDRVLRLRCRDIRKRRTSSNTFPAIALSKCRACWRDLEAPSPGNRIL